jgi:hypothetical protein
LCAKTAPLGVPASFVAGPEQGSSRARAGLQGSRSCQRRSKPISLGVTSHTCNRQALGTEHSVPSPFNRVWRREEAGRCGFGDHRGANYGMGPAGTSDSRAVGRCRKAVPRLRPVPFSLSSREFSRGTFEFVSPALLRGSQRQGRAGAGQRTLGPAEMTEAEHGAPSAGSFDVSVITLFRVRVRSDRFLDTQRDCARGVWVWWQGAGCRWGYPELALGLGGVFGLHQAGEEGRSSSIPLDLVPKLEGKEGCTIRTGEIHAGATPRFAHLASTLNEPTEDC